MADPVFRSKLSNDLDAFITQKRAAGHPYDTSARVLGYLDDMIIEKYPESSVLTKEICNAWIKECSKLHQNTLLRRVTPVRQFGKYLVGTGKPAYIIPGGIPHKQVRYDAHIFTEAELTAFFASIDRCAKSPIAPYRCYVIPVIFRLLFRGGGAYTEVSVTGTVISENDPYIMAFMPYYIQGNNGSNNNRVPVATAVYLFNLEPNTTYRYTNQFVDDNDGPETAGAGNVIYAYMGGFYRSTSPSLATEGGYGEFMTDEDGAGFVWFMNEPTANARFTPGNHVYLRIRINDGHDGTTVEQTFTSEDYATVLNFGTEYDAYNGSAFYVKSGENPMSFAMLMPDGEDARPLYSTSIETTGIDYGSINQYADFYQDFVSGQNGWFGGILPNDCESGVNVIFILNIEGYLQNAYFVEDGLWNPDANTVNPTNGLDEPIFIDLSDDGVEEDITANIKVWSTDHEFVIENGDDAHYTMTVYNVLGQHMMQQQINAGCTERIGHSLATGLYVISLQNNQNKVAAKVIVK